MAATSSLRSSLRNTPVALRALFAVVTVIAAFAYGINAWQVFGFAEHVWRLPLPLCLGAAGVADSLSLAGLFATYLLRNAPGRVRGYAWTVFLGMTGASIAAAESFAAWRKLPAAQQSAYGWSDAQVASGVIVVALALATHLLIVARRHVQLEPVVVPAATKPPPATAKPKPPPAAGKSAAKPPAKPAAGPGADDVKADAIRRVVVERERASDVARDVGRSKRTIELWTKPHREADPTRSANGAAPEVNVP